jgi:hypothetical protein
MFETASDNLSLFDPELLTLACVERAEETTKLFKMLPAEFKELIITADEMIDIH